MSFIILFFLGVLERRLRQMLAKRFLLTSGEITEFYTQVLALLLFEKQKGTFILVFNHN